MSQLDWQPNERGTKMLIDVLASIQAPNTEAQRKGNDMSMKLQEHEEFAAYAGLVFCNRGLTKPIRMQAGLMLKRYINHNKDRMKQNIFEISKRYIAQAILDPFKEIRRTAANVQYF